jgi:hypothetical protein
MVSANMSTTRTPIGHGKRLRITPALVAAFGKALALQSEFDDDDPRYDGYRLASRAFLEVLSGIKLRKPWDRNPLDCSTDECDDERHPEDWRRGRELRIALDAAHKEAASHGH